MLGISWLTSLALMSSRWNMTAMDISRGPCVSNTRNKDVVEFGEGVIGKSLPEVVCADHDNDIIN